MVKHRRLILTVLVLAIVVGALSGALTSYLLSKYKSQDALREEFYKVETATHVSPHHIRKAMDKGDESFILVDLRSEEEYIREHIIGAVSIPAYKSPDKSAYGDVERIVNSFRQLPKDKEIITYCYSIPCMTARKVGKMLAEHGIYVKALGIGWNEWRYFWELWNHEHEWDQTDVEDYVVSGKQPGTPILKVNSSVCLPGEFGC